VHADGEKSEKEAVKVVGEPVPKVQPTAVTAQGSTAESAVPGRLKGEFPFTYRGGTAGSGNLTPRRTDTGGLSTFERLDRAAKVGEKAQKVDTNKLDQLKALQDPPPEFHVSIFPAKDGKLDPTALSDWMDSKEKKSESPHPLTTELQRAIVEVVKRQE
jgi:hypothetical protein